MLSCTSKMFWYNITPAAIVRNALYVTRVLYS